MTGFNIFDVGIPIVLVVLDVSIRIFAVIFIPRNRRPQTATAWLLAIFFQPYVGIVLFLIFGSRRLPRKRRLKQREINDYILNTTEGFEDVSADHPWLDTVVALNRHLGAMPLVGGNAGALLGDTKQTLAAMTDAVNSATAWVHAEFYIFAYDPTTKPFFAALEAAVARGLTVRVLLDHVAGLRTVHYLRTIRQFKRIGVEWKLMLPIQPWRGRWQRPDLRNHRKLLIVDGRVAFTGSMNVIDPSYNKRGNIRRGLQWKDLMVRFEGPIVAGINALFVTDWYSETDELLIRESADAREATEAVVGRAAVLDAQVVPSGPGFAGENNLRLFNSLLYAARENIVISSPYFVPDESMLYAITTAAQSGVNVELFVSEIGDQFFTYHAQRSYYEALLKAGVRIWLYPKPIVLHSKFFMIDDEVSVIGSSNMDMRSFSLNLEISIMVHGASFVDDLRVIAAEYRSRSRELDLDEWMARPLPSRVLDNVARLTASVQ